MPRRAPVVKVFDILRLQVLGGSLLSKQLPKTVAGLDVLVTNIWVLVIIFLFFINNEELLPSACFLCHATEIKNESGTPGWLHS